MTVMDFKALDEGDTAAMSFADQAYLVIRDKLIMLDIRPNAAIVESELGRIGEMGDVDRVMLAAQAELVENDASFRQVAACQNDRHVAPRQGGGNGAGRSTRAKHPRHAE